MGINFFFYFKNQNKKRTVFCGEAFPNGVCGAFLRRSVWRALVLFCLKSFGGVGTFLKVPTKNPHLSVPNGFPLQVKSDFLKSKQDF